MNNEKLALIIGSFLLVHASSVIGALIWAVKHIVEYRLLREHFANAQIKIEELERDIDQAHSKIRNLQKDSN